MLLVKKVESSRRFCIDYHKLNNKTSKDKFFISVVDELHDAKYFTKLDLQSSYHQVWMHPDDIDKTVFYAHHDHIEFLIIPFSLSNASATFHVLMNDNPMTLLCRFVLVFFDDILIYSSLWFEHLQHVCLILDAFHAHVLHLKWSKCSIEAP